jgi:DNA-binding CsgD family transcriptional regulator
MEEGAYLAFEADADHITGVDALHDIQLVINLLHISQTWCGQPDGGIEYLRQEVARITQGVVHLSVSRKKSVKRHSSRTTSIFPLQFRNIVYGILTVEKCSKNPERLAIPDFIVHLLVQVCSWLLYSLEQAAFIEGQSQQLTARENVELTKRESEVVLLMCRGYSQDEIADILSISPATVKKHKQHIYDQLGVHTERDALLMAYHTGNFSLVDKSL